MSFSVSLRAQGDLKFSNICHDCVTGIWANSACEVTLKDMTRRETFKFCDLVWLILEFLWYFTFSTPGSAGDSGNVC